MPVTWPRDLVVVGPSVEGDRPAGAVVAVVTPGPVATVVAVVTPGPAGAVVAVVTPGPVATVVAVDVRLTGVVPLVVGLGGMVVG